MSAQECVFCRIVAGEAEADVIYQDEEMTAFWDARPAAPVHILIIPNRHISSINGLDETDAPLLGRLILRAKKLAAEQGVTERGYRLVFNTGPEGGQTVYHLHLHLIAGKRLPVFRDGAHPMK